MLATGRETYDAITNPYQQEALDLIRNQKINSQAVKNEILAQQEAALSDYFRDLVIQVGYVQFTPGLEDIEKPLLKRIIWMDFLKINFKNLFNYNILIAQTKVESEDGYLKKELSEATGLKFEGDNFKLFHRKNEDVFPAVVLLGGKLTKAFFMPYYLGLQFNLINKLYTTTRVYEGLLDFANNIGGVAEVTIMVFAIALSMHHSLCFSLYLLNSLENSNQVQQKKPMAKLNQVADQNFEAPPTSTQITYFQLLCFKIGCCCCKKS